ncbi:hypothetical protein [Silvibacterium acidisoli]|uniref:hypothetical protein n=1 Tax=Acidobacteriaceae bacterium ZG23-2 TaxID=2883246 RepID=UPI00406D2EE8
MTMALLDYIRVAFTIQMAIDGYYRSVVTDTNDLQPFAVDLGVVLGRLWFGIRAY